MMRCGETLDVSVCFVDDVRWWSVVIVCDEIDAMVGMALCPAYLLGVSVPMRFSARQVARSCARMDACNVGCVGVCVQSSMVRQEGWRVPYLQGMGNRRRSLDKGHHPSSHTPCLVCRCVVCVIGGC